MIHDLLPDDGPPDMRAIHRFAVVQAATARRRGRIRAARDWRRVIKKALRALRFAADLTAGRVRCDPHSSHSIFSETPENFVEPAAPASAPHPDRRRTFREGRRRR